MDRPDKTPRAPMAVAITCPWFIRRKNIAAETQSCHGPLRQRCRKSTYTRQSRDDPEGAKTPDVS